MGVMRWMRGNDSASAGMIGAGLNELHAAFNGTKNTLVVERAERALRRDDEAVEGDLDPSDNDTAGNRGAPRTPGTAHTRRKAWSGAGAVTIRRPPGSGADPAPTPPTELAEPTEPADPAPSAGQ